VACSALRRAYRDVLRSKAPGVVFLHLAGEERVIRRRLEQRTDHFVPPDLLRSQLQTLEPLGEDEPGIVVDLASPVDEIVETALAELTHRTLRRP
jgi:beta-N-acetylhexosaminidase